MKLQDATNIYATSRYVVDPTAFGTPYQTIQSALDAANDANVLSGGLTPAVVQVRPSIYIEDLVLYDNITLEGTDRDTVIVHGRHMPPDHGNCLIRGLTLASASDIIFSVFPGDSIIIFRNCIFNITNGYAIDLFSWTAPGQFIITNCDDISTENKGINNGGDVSIDINESIFGKSATGSSIISDITLRNGSIRCALNLFNNASLDAFNSAFAQKIFANNGSIVRFHQCNLNRELNISNNANLVANNTLMGLVIASDDAVLIFENSELDIVGNHFSVNNNAHVEIRSSYIGCPIEINDSGFVLINDGAVVGGASTAITINSTLVSCLNNVVISSTAPLAIDGTGTLKIGQVVFSDTTACAPTITFVDNTLEVVGNSQTLVDYNLPTTTATEGSINWNQIPTIHTYGTNNFFAGANAGNFTLTSTGSTCVGVDSGGLLTSGNDNSCFGYASGLNITSGSANCIFGVTGYVLTTGIENCLYGTAAGGHLISSKSCIAIGAFAMRDNVVCNGGIAIGRDALAFFTNDVGSIIESGLVFIGYQAGYGADNLKNTVAIGSFAAAGMNIGPSEDNVFIGDHAASTIKTSTNNVIIGAHSRAGVTTAQNCIIGAYSGTAYTTTESNNILIGYLQPGVIGDNNTIRLGVVGSHTDCYVAGIYGSAVGGTNELVIVDNVGKLGSIAIPPILLPWTREAGPAVNAIVNHGYIPTAAVTFTLPAVCAIGDTISFAGEDLFIIQCNAGQSIQGGNNTTSVAGTLNSTNDFDSVTLVCRLANTTWGVTSMYGTFNYL